jgi:hypothetical protein
MPRRVPEPSIIGGCGSRSARTGRDHTSAALFAGTTREPDREPGAVALVVVVNERAALEGSLIFPQMQRALKRTLRIVTMT